MFYSWFILKKKELCNFMILLIIIVFMYVYMLNYYLLKVLILQSISLHSVVNMIKI